MNLVINEIELLKFEGSYDTNDTIHTNIQINGPKLVQTQEYVWAIATIIFSYTGSPQVKISQKVFFWGGGYFFLTHTVYRCLISQIKQRRQVSQRAVKCSILTFYGQFYCRSDFTTDTVCIDAPLQHPFTLYYFSDRNWD